MIVDRVEGIVAIDGKTIRNSSDKERKASHIVTAFAAENDIILGQLKSEEKSNETTAIPKLLETLKLKGCIVTIDAMGCQKAIVEKIRERKGHYVIGLKKNQGKLHAEAVNFFNQAMVVDPEEAECDYSKTVEKHGRERGLGDIKFRLAAEER